MTLHPVSSGAAEAVFPGLLPARLPSAGGPGALTMLPLPRVSPSQGLGRDVGNDTGAAQAFLRDQQLGGTPEF